MFWVFGYRILALQSGIKPKPPTLEGKILTNGLPRRPQVCTFQSRLATAVDSSTVTRTPFHQAHLLHSLGEMLSPLFIYSTAL